MRLLFGSILFWFSFLGICLTVRAQTVNFEDGFEDGNFTENPTWSGDTSHYTVVTGNPNYLLQLQGEESGSSYLSVPSTATVGGWEFYVVFEGFVPSGSNKAEIFLMSDIPDLNGPVNGYALKAGESGDDVFRIVRYDNGSESAVILSDTTVVDSEGGGYRIRIVRDAAGSWQLQVGKGYDGKLIDSGNRAFDSTYTGSAYFGVKTTYTSSRADKFYYDFKIDLPPFTLTDLQSTPTGIELTFNRPYDIQTVQAGDFEVDKSVGHPVSVSFPATNKIRLAYTPALPSNIYTLNIRNISDLHGEVLNPATAHEFIIYGLPDPSDIVINEFMYDPPPGLPEYVELKNRSRKFFDIQGWELSDQSRTEKISPVPFSFGPDTFLVISSDTVSLFRHFGHRNYLELGSSFPSLNNSGDAILINSDQGILLDSLFYVSGWGGQEVALERRSARAPSNSPANWGNVPEGAGTPGTANLLPPDRTPPELVQLQVKDAKTLVLHFSEEINPESATEVTNYSLSPKIDVQEITTAGNRITLSLAENLTADRTYEISIRGTEDIFRNRAPAQTVTFNFRNFGKPNPGDIVINEFLYLPQENENPEFIELLNNTARNFDLSGWTIGDAAGTAQLGSGTYLSAGNYLVLTADPVFAANLQNAQEVSGFPSLNDTGDPLFLRDPEGTTFDSLHYTRDWPAAKSNHSLERKDPLGASNDPSNWAISSASNGISAGIKNTTYQPDEIPPTPVFAGALPDNTIRLHFNEFIKLTDDTYFQLDGAFAHIASFDSTKGNTIILYMPSSFQLRKAQTITVSNLNDVKSNLQASAQIPLAFPVRPSDLAINEIMFQPLSNPDDHLPDQSEYVELYNIRDFALSLEGIQISGAPDENGNTGAMLPVSTRAKWIPPGGFALIYADPEPVLADSRINRFFELDNPNPHTVLRVDRSTLGLASSGHALFVRDSTGSAIDSVRYDQSWHNPNLLDVRGIALERISPEGLSNNPSNWSSSVTPLGGTPGSANSIYLQAKSAIDPAGISFSTNPFSPDGDGVDDHLIINYSLEEPNYLLNVQIYDRYGRIVRRLADGYAAGTEGFLIWDGRRDNGSRNRIGIYIIIVEAYNNRTGRKTTFKESVVLAKRLE